MEVNEEQSIEKIVSSANEYINELINALENIIERLNKKIEGDRIVVHHYIKEAQKYDVNFTPDESTIKKFSLWIDNLMDVKEKLLNLNLNQENIFDEEIYIKKAEELIGLMENILGEKNENLMVNKSRFEEACEKKRQAEIELSNINIELEALETQKRELEQENEEIQKQIDKTRFKFFNRKRNAVKLSNSETIKDLEEQIRVLKGRKGKLEIASQANHFVPKTEGEDPVNPKPAEIMEENKGIEPGDE